MPTQQSIKVVYDELSLITVELNRLAEQATTITNDLARCRAGLHGEWIGFGADNFFNEFDTDLLSGMIHLKIALQSASELVGNIGREFNGVEMEQAAHIKALPAGWSPFFIGPAPPPEGFVPPPSAPSPLTQAPSPAGGPNLPTLADMQPHWVGPVVIIEVKRPPIKQGYTEFGQAVSGEMSGGMGAVTGTYEEVNRYDSFFPNLGNAIKDMVQGASPADALNNNIGGPDEVEQNIVIEGGVGADVPGLGNYGLPDASATGGVKVEFPLNDPDTAALGGIQLSGEGGPISVNGEIMSNDMGALELTLTFPVVPHPHPNGGESVFDPNIASGELGQFDLDGALTHTITVGVEQSTNNTLQIPVPLHVFNQYNGDIEAFIHQDIYCALYVNNDEWRTLFSHRAICSHQYGQYQGSRARSPYTFNTQQYFEPGTGGQSCEYCESNAGWFNGCAPVTDRIADYR